MFVCGADTVKKNTHNFRGRGMAHSITLQTSHYMYDKDATIHYLPSLWSLFSTTSLINVCRLCRNCSSKPATISATLSYPYSWGRFRNPWPAWQCTCCFQISLTWLISSPVLDTRCSTCSSLLFKSPNLQNSRLLLKHIPSNGRSLKTSDHPWSSNSSHFPKSQALPQAQLSITSATSALRISFRLQTARCRRCAESQGPTTLRSISFHHGCGGFERSPRLPDLLRGSHQATTRCVLLLRPARRPQTRASGNQNGHL
jgi:hypothetical protein